MELPKDLIQALDNVETICVLTGAGISAESGIPTFRGPEGYWAKYRPEELATAEAFLRDPVLVWSWYQHRRDALVTAQPNAGHRALVRIEGAARRFALVTQNVDGLHRMAGSRNQFELHGNIRINRCHNCGSEIDLGEFHFQNEVPRCSCGGMIRPGVVWFGEALPAQAWAAAVQAAESCDCFLSVGTSSLVYPAAGLPQIAMKRASLVVEINTETTPLSAAAAHHLRASAGSALPAIADVLEQRSADPV